MKSTCNVWCAQCAGSPFKAGHHVFMLDAAPHYNITSLGK